jgi:hexosaminidase
MQNLTYRIASFAFILLLGSAPVSAQTFNPMPMPAELTPGTGRLTIDRNFSVALEGYREPRLERAAVRFARHLAIQTGLPLSDTIDSGAAQATLVVHCDHAGETVQSIREDESYQLEITPAHARLTARTPVGALRGMETFLQLVTIAPTGFGAPAMSIEDRPRFAWRGFMIDVVRHWMPTDVLLRNIDGMAAVKLNVLHLHLSDDQGFRIESKRYPRLQERASGGLYYTQVQIKELIEYARDRGIRVVPEFDMPGHTTSWLVAYPEYGSAPGPYTLEHRLAVIANPALDPTREEVYSFLDGLIGEMAGLFPDAYFHTGGDEVNGIDWDANPRITAFKKAHGMKDNRESQAYFTRRLQALVAKHGKRMIGWDEILDPNLPKDILVQSWNGQKTLADAARMGFQTILSTGYYLDMLPPATEIYTTDPMKGETASLTPEQQSRILGGEACLWTEWITPQIVDSRIWPRLAVVAERLWSPENVNDVDAMYKRLEIISGDLEWLGLEHRSSYPLMLRRLTGMGPIDSLKVLADVLEPLKNYGRTPFHYTVDTPLNRLVDSVQPESATARAFAGWVDHLQANKDAVRKQLTVWRDNHATLLPLLQESELLQEDIPLSEDLAALGRAGLEALDNLDSGKPAPPDWVNEQLASMVRAAQPRAEMNLMVAPPVRKLVEMAGKGTF